MFLITFIEENVLGTFGGKCASYKCVNLFLVCLFCSIDLYVCALCQYYVLVTRTVQYILGSDIMMLPALLFLFKIALASGSSVWYTNVSFVLFLFVCVKEHLYSDRDCIKPL